MANPVLPELNDAEAAALSDVVHAGTGTRHVAFQVDDTSSPKLFTRLKMVEKFYGDLLARFGGACVALGGLNVGVFALEYKIGATDKSFAGVATQALTASVTSYLYLDADQTLKIDESAWPGGDIFRVAKVTTSGSAVTAIVDARLHNFLIGIVNAWYSVPAAGTVDMDGQALQDVGQSWPIASTELTLASDTITPTLPWHSVDTQADAAADDLVTLTADAAKIGRKVILRCENAARVVTIKSTGNIKLKHGNLVLDDVEKFVLCLQITATTWICEPMNFASFGPLLQDLDANNKKILNIGTLALESVTAVTLSADTLAVTNSYLRMVPESGGSDDLKTISGGEYEQFLLIVPNAYTPITVYDVNASGGDNIRLSVIATTLILAGPLDWLFLFNDGGLWTELARSKHTLASLVGTGQVIPYAVDFHYPGTVTDGMEKSSRPTTIPYKIKGAQRGRVITAPTGGSCIVDIRKNGASIFAADANRINIAVGTNEDASDSVDVDVAVGDVVSVYVITANTAADLTVSLRAFVDATTA